jgi:hypothetical protein
MLLLQLLFPCRCFPCSCRCFSRSCFCPRPPSRRRPLFDRHHHHPFRFLSVFFFCW